MAPGKRQGNFHPEAPRRLSEFPKFFFPVGATQVGHVERNVTWVPESPHGEVSWNFWYHVAEKENFCRVTEIWGSLLLVCSVAYST